MDDVSESSYATGEDESQYPCDNDIETTVVDCATQTATVAATPVVPPPTRPSRRPHHTSRLQRHHTSDHIYDVRKSAIPKSSLRSKAKESYGGLSDSYPFIVSKSLNCDSGYTSSGRRSRNSHYYPWERQEYSSTLSMTPPPSLDYLASMVPAPSRGNASPAGSVTPNGRSGSSGVFLNPTYLQGPMQCSQSISDLVNITIPANDCCNCPCRLHGEQEHNPTTSYSNTNNYNNTNGYNNNSHITSESLSWRRLHMSRAKLKATATTSELLSGFAMVAMVELQINEPTNVPEWLFIMFAVCTTVLVAVHIFALMISTYLLPNIDAVSKMESPLGGALRDSPHERMRGFIELAWAFSTVLGLFLFLLEVAILCWVKFWDYSFAAATAATVIVIPVMVVFVAFAIHFYHTLVVQKVRNSKEDMQQLENMKKDLDTATVKIHLV